MALIHPLVQDTKLGIGVNPSTINILSTRYSDHLHDEVDPLGRTLYLSGPSAPDL